MSLQSLLEHVDFALRVSPEHDDLHSNTVLCGLNVCEGQPIVLKQPHDASSPLEWQVRCVPSTRLHSHNRWLALGKVRNRQQSEELSVS